MVRAAGLEPARPCGRGILSPLRIPISPRPHVTQSVKARPCGWQAGGRFPHPAKRAKRRLKD